MYRFQIRAETQLGETIALVGSTAELGSWDEARCVHLHTSRDRYPIWSVEVALPSLSDRQVDYQYLRIRTDGSVEWESLEENRWVAIEPDPPSPIVVEDGVFGTIRSAPYGYFADPIPQSADPLGKQGLKIVVIGSSVALGCNAWLLRGWAWQLGQTLYQQGHQLVNLSEVGANVATTIARFSQVVVPEQPDMVILSLSLGNEGLASSLPKHHRTIQRRFETGLQQLICMIEEIGARPVLGAVYPNGDYSLIHYRLLWDTHQRMLTWGVPVLNWLGALNDGKGRWQGGIASDPAHPNTSGHQRMYRAIDLSLFQPAQAALTVKPPVLPAPTRLYQDKEFSIFACETDRSLQIVNASAYPYSLTSGWREVQTAMRATQLPAGLYMAEASNAGAFSLFLQDNKTIETPLSIPAATDLTFHPVLRFFALPRAQILFYDGQLSILKVGDRHLYVFNESDNEYTLHPMWREVRAALSALPAGVYQDPMDLEAPFRTLMIGDEGLESRVKVAARSGIKLTYQCPLSAISRVAIIPLGDRCAVRMLLYKLGYDGPAFPFDLTRTTHLGDVADIIRTNFYDMWNPDLLHYNPEAGRIYHTKWTGLSFAHEVEDGDDPTSDMSPIHQRMRARYTARSNRFGYTVAKADKLLFIRTGICARNAVVDLVDKLQTKCQGKPFHVLLISLQSSDEFAHLPQVIHTNLEFNPDRMYDDLGHWDYCAELMQNVLNSLSISSQNLFWCPPTPPMEGST